MKMIVTAAALLSLSCSSAFAHAHLTGATPADGAVVASSPVSLSLYFTEAIEPKLSGATLKRPDGAPVDVGTASLGAADDRLMSVALPRPLGQGVYTVEWHAFSRDGHTTRGTYHFTVGR